MAEPIPEPTPAERTQGYRVTKWHEHDNFECLQCQYATLWLPKMLDHLATDVHIWAYPNTSPPETSNEPDY